MFEEIQLILHQYMYKTMITDHLTVTVEYVVEK